MVSDWAFYVFYLFFTTKLFKCFTTKIDSFSEELIQRATERVTKDKTSISLLQIWYFTMNIALFLDIIGRGETFSVHGIQLSGFRMALASFPY